MTAKILLRITESEDSEIHIESMRLLSEDSTGKEIEVCYKAKELIDALFELRKPNDLLDVRNY